MHVLYNSQYAVTSISLFIYWICEVCWKFLNIFNSVDTYLKVGFHVFGCLISVPFVIQCNSHLEFPFAFL